ncbi:hypothetical protein Acsp03_62060 [Actinomadura sp. NBRC 104412]|uniref:hypothetical protein n=1 Tax=Actinomadura sp. NBRC 104412 TaxID=3032203 RepID=UPI0024A05226|nr:hypothetical protein [Actinomadura sp. NBRC 104412]GLZ08740.1 hypothetical protein Acsp03_62060 [Actinomadura sp. NBRC 104412]
MGETAFLFPYEGEEPEEVRAPSEWRRLGRRLRVWALGGVGAIASVIALDVLPFPDYGVLFPRW